MKLSERSSVILPSLTRKLFNYAKQFDDVVDLTLGDPDFNTPDYIKNAAKCAIELNKSHYSMNAGIAEARNAVSDRVRDIWNIDCDPDKNVIITVGGMEALYLALLSIVDCGDEVILFAPYYVNYLQMVQMCGGRTVIIDAYDPEKGLVIERKKLEEFITDRTVAIIINSPNNPTGSIISPESLKVVDELAEKHDLTIISDEVYRTLVFDDCKHQSILQYEFAKKHTVLIDSLSKEFSMTGWRIGYAVGPEEIISSMIKFQENVAACVNVPSQYALVDAYKVESDDRNRMLKEFEKRRDILCEGLGKIPVVSFVKPQGAFYLFLNIGKLHMDSEEFAYKLLETQHIAVVPGKAYGENYDSYVRIAFTKNIEMIKAAIKGIKDFVEN